MSAFLETNPEKSFSPPAAASEELKAKNRILLKNESDKIKTQLAVIDEQIVQAQAEKATARASIKKIERLLPNVRFRTDQYRDIYEKGSIAKSFFLEKELIQYEEDLNVQRKTLAEIETKLHVLRRCHSGADVDETGAVRQRSGSGSHGFEQRRPPVRRHEHIGGNQDRPAAVD